jgi:DNA adenine methylase
LIHLDPPYFEQGRQLYYGYYNSEDHEKLAKFIQVNMKRKNWIVSYDNVAPIRKPYSPFRSIVYNVGYSARETRTGREVMFFSPNLTIPDLVGPVVQIGKVKLAA